MFRFLLDFFENYSKRVSTFYYFYGKLILPIAVLLVKTLTVFYGLSSGTGFQQNFLILLFTTSTLNLIYYFYKENLIIFSLYILSNVMIRYYSVVDRFFIFIIKFVSKAHYWVFAIIFWYFLIILSGDYCMWFSYFNYFGYGVLMHAGHFICKIFIIFSMSFLYFIGLAILILLNTLFEKDVFLKNSGSTGRTLFEIYVFLLFHIIDNFLNLNKSNILSKKILYNIFKLKEIVSLNKFNGETEVQKLLNRIESKLTYEMVLNGFPLSKQEYWSIEKKSRVEFLDNKSFYFKENSLLNKRLLTDDEYYDIRFKIIIIYGLFGISFIWFLTCNSGEELFRARPDIEARSYPNSSYEPYKVFFYIRKFLP